MYKLLSQEVLDWYYTGEEIPSKDWSKRIAELEQRNESLEEKARQWDMHNCTTHAMNLAQKNRNLEQQLGETNEALAACQSEAGGLLAENERLKGVIEADDKRLSDAAISVWGEHIRGCDTPQEMAELINYLRPLAKSAELELHESFISGMERAAEIVKSRLTNNDAKPYYEVWNSALYGAETAIRAELEPVTRPEER